MCVPRSQTTATVVQWYNKRTLIFHSPTRTRGSTCYQPIIFTVCRLPRAVCLKKACGTYSDIPQTKFIPGQKQQEFESHQSHNTKNPFLFQTLFFFSVPPVSLALFSCPRRYRHTLNVCSQFSSSARVQTRVYL